MNDLLTSDDFKEMCIQEWSKHKTISVIARIASRYYSTPIKANDIRKVLTSCGIVLPPIKKVASIYDTQLGR